MFIDFPFLSDIIFLKFDFYSLNYYYSGGEPRLELGVHRLWNYVELFWNSLDNAPSSLSSTWE